MLNDEDICAAHAHDPMRSCNDAIAVYVALHHGMQCTCEVERRCIANSKRREKLMIVDAVIVMMNTRVTLID